MLITEVSIIAKASFNFCQVAVSENVTFHPFFYSLYNSSHPVWLLAEPIWCLCRCAAQLYMEEKAAWSVQWCHAASISAQRLRCFSIIAITLLCLFHYSQQRWHIVYHAWCHFIYQSQEIFWLLGINCSVISRCKKKRKICRIVPL